MSKERLENQANKETHLWERQPWDTDKSFFVFHVYYLPQDPPRSLNEAYKAYRFQSGSNPVPKKAPGAWQKWYRGQDARGRKIPSAATWEERANAWDDHQAAKDRDVWEERRKELREMEWELSQRASSLAIKMLDVAPSFIRDGKPFKFIDPTGEFDYAKTLALKAELIPRLAEAASKIGRLATGEPTERTEHEVHFDLEEWKRKRQERLDRVAALKVPEE